MKKLSLLFGILIAFCYTMRAQTVLPVFSTQESPVWYYIQFKTGAAYLTDQGSGGKVQTANKSSADVQKWQLIGTQESFLLRSKNGNYLAWNGNYFTTAGTGIELKIVKSGNDANYWEIQRKSSSQSMNQWGGTGAGRDLGEYTAGDPNNPLSFILASVVPPVFSTDDNSVWYYVQFKNGNGVLKDMGLDVLVRTATVDLCDEQLWKLVGTQDNFQIINKLGHYAVVSSKSENVENAAPNTTPIRTSETKQEGGFSLIETESGYAPGWEIQVNSNVGRCWNQWGGGGIGKSIGVYGKNDPNNPVNFVNPDDMVYADYKFTGTESFTPANALTLWYDQPATTTGVDNIWMEYSLPIGNGQLGACLFGGIYRDEIQFNEKTLWTGSPNDMQGAGSGYGQYKNFGSIFVEDLSGNISFGTAKAAKGYVRYLDIENGTAGVRYTDNDESTSYERTYFVSEPDQVLAARYTATGDNKLYLKFSYAPGADINASTVAYTDGQATFSGKLTTVSYNTRFRVVPVGDNATMTASESGIVVENADGVLLLMAAGTDYDSSVASCVSGTSTLASTMESRVNGAAAKGWNALYADHVNNFTSYMGRVKLQLDGAAVPTIPTDQLVDDYNNSGKNVTGRESYVLFLEQLYFAYGRYLLISSSRGINVPNNLQGIWNDKSNAPWNSDIHTNINIQMNYWPAEPTNLSELHEPLLDYIITMAAGDNWKKAAERGGVSKGWTVFTESNIFGGMSVWGSNYFVANVWYCSHLWQHYRYTLDKEYLQRAFPAMWSCAEFWFERMIKDRKINDGTYVCPDEYSPEQNEHPTEDATAHAQQMVYMHFVYTKQAIEVLGREACGLTDEQIAKLDDYIAHTDQGLHTEPFKGGSWSSWATPLGVKTGDLLLREWKYTDYDVSSDKGHRHISHLMCLYPYNQISPSSPYFEPAVNSLKLRGDEATGWSMGWKVNLWARALDGDHAHKIIKNALKHSTSYGTNQHAGGIYYNLWDSHAPFQIDGNFGVCSGISEMLMQSHTDTIQLLPALASMWDSGSVTGLKAVGDFTVDIVWAAGKLSVATITSNKGQPLTINYPNIAGKKVSVNGEEVSYTIINRDNIKVEAVTGDVVNIDYNAEATHIRTLANQKKSGDIYTIDGRRVTDVRSAEQGVYIADGKKVLKY